MKPVDEQHCPHCEHPILNWDIMCPGCDRIPKHTWEGRRVLWGRRAVGILAVAAGVGAVSVSIGWIVAIGDLSARRSDGNMFIHQVRRVSSELRMQQARLEHVQQNTRAFEEAQAQSGRWVKDTLPTLINLAHNREAPVEARVGAVEILGTLCAGSSALRVSSSYRSKVTQALKPLLATEEESLRRAAESSMNALRKAQAARSL